MEKFHPFSPLHAAVVATFVALTVGCVALRRRLRRSGDVRLPDRLDRAIALATAAAWAFTTFVPLWPPIYQHSWSLPLHVCDVTVLAVPVALATCWRPARAVAYFWGIGLSSQGLFTPDLQDGPARLGFWLFWANHFAVVGGALYDVAARGYRPAWKDFGVAVGLGVAYVALVLPFDLLTGLNYGYLGRTAPGQPTLVDVLGPWPGRVGVMVALAIAVMLLLMLPWEVAPRRCGGSSPSDGEGLGRA